MLNWAGTGSFGATTIAGNGALTLQQFVWAVIPGVEA